MNARGVPTVGQALKDGEKISLGSELKLPSHRVYVQVCINSPSGDSVEMDLGLGASRQEVEVVDDQIEDNMCPDPVEADSVSSAVHDVLGLGLDFSPGREFAKRIRKEFLSTVHPTRDSFHFTMVVSFGRASFRLTEDNVSLALEAAIGGLCDELKVSVIRDRVFSFTVSSKQIGFRIQDHRSYSCRQFKCFFHLWSRGGPNWMREFNLWQNECNQ
jgi:hypothetical protein